LLTLIMGPEFSPAAPMLRGLALVGLMAALLLPFESYFPATGRPDLGLRLAAIEVVASVALDLTLIPLWATTGALIAAALTFAVGLLTAVVLILKLGHALPHWSDVVRALTARTPAASA
jgi:O-antigen/teichoic acid export membrane protein